MIDESVIPYSLPEEHSHSFFFIDQCIDIALEAKLHSHDAWEIYYILKGHGTRLAGDTVIAFMEGDAALIPPNMHHCWKYDMDSTDTNGRVHYLMIAFSHNLIKHCIDTFPEIRIAFTNVTFPTEALKFGKGTSDVIGKILSGMIGMSDCRRLAEMLALLPYVFNTNDYIATGKPIRIEKDVRRLQHITEYVMAHYVHDISLQDIASEVGMNKSAFCSYFKKHKGMTFSQFVTQYRLNTACELLKNTKKQISEICYMVGFNDPSHFTHVFIATHGISPSKYRLTTTLQNSSNT